MSRKPRKAKGPEPEPAEGEVVYNRRLTQADILEAVNLLLRSRGEIKGVGYFRHRFGIIGNPQMILMGEPPPDAGKMYIDWHFTPLENVAKHPTFHRKP